MNNQRKCKFGMNCRDLAQGNCRFLHDGGSQNTGFQNQRNPQQGGGGYQNPNYQSGGRGGRGGGGRGDQYGGFVPDDYNQGGGMGGRGRGGGGRGGPNPQYQNTQQNQNPNQNKPNDISQSFCRFFHVGECNKGPKCTRKHQFINDGSIKRLLKQTSLPRDPNSKLGVFTNQNAKYYSLREGKEVCFFQYDANSGEITLVNGCTWTIPEAIETHYFNTKLDYLYFAYENKNTQLTSIGIYEILTGKVLAAQNAHKSKVTDMTIAQINSTKTLLSSSRDGTIKAWNMTQNSLVYNQAFSDGLKNCYNTTGQKIQILFMNTENIDGNQVIVAGTSDARVLFWVGPSLNYQQALLKPPYSKVLMAKFFCSGGQWLGVAIGWSEDNKSCALCGIYLSNMQTANIIEKQVNQPKQLIASIEVSDNLLFVNNMNGLIVIYKIATFQEVGCMMFNNLVFDMIVSKSVTQTGIPLTHFFALQKLEQKGPGSLQIFLLAE